MEFVAEEQPLADLYCCTFFLIVQHIIQIPIFNVMGLCEIFNERWKAAIFSEGTLSACIVRQLCGGSVRYQVYTFCCCFTYNSYTVCTEKGGGSREQAVLCIREPSQPPRASRLVASCNNSTSTLPGGS